jgi:endoglucanase
MWRFSVLVCLILSAVLPALRAEIHLRWNQAGFAPAQTKTVVAIGDADLEGRPWFVWRDGAVVLRGYFEASVTGVGDHTPFAFNHVADFTPLGEAGTYEFVTAGCPPAAFRVAESPTLSFLALPLRHLRLMRSGSDDTRGRRFSHPGDARAPVWVPAGDPADGKWTAATPARTVDAVGGWYDAGDQIKFTLTIAATTYHLLAAHRLHPALAAPGRNLTGLPDLLDEARHGLEYLMRVHPDRDTFVIQVGNAEDHSQDARLPENDKLDGKRPALCALSQVHMGAAASALASAARLFGEIGRTEDAERYGRMARIIYLRARQPDTIVTAFERGEVNDFYHDPDARDQLAVAAMELHALTGEAFYLQQAIAYAPPAATEVGWADWNATANAALAPHDAAAQARLRAEMSGYIRRSAEAGAPWGVPGRYGWGSLARWIGMANAARQHAGAEGDPLFWAMVDYTFGRNNWGVSFLFDESLPNTLRHLYSPVYKLLRRFPTGALSEGPAGRAWHDSLGKYFQIPADDPFHRFNTAAGVFFDNDADFMCQEATITAQADAVILLALASRPVPAP